jgi:uncharacterized protein
MIKIAFFLKRGIMITNILPTYTIHPHIDVKIPMRDNVLLSADIFLPSSEGSFPIILTRTPYGNNDPQRLQMKKWFVERGFGYVFQDCRGRYDSEGEWEPFRNEREDGWDTLDWIARQPFCNGNIGMTGGSYEGYTSWIQAPDSHCALKAIAPLVPLPDPIINVPYQNGAFFWNMIVWGLFVHGKTNQNISFIDWPSLYNFRPLKDMAKKVGMSNNKTWKHWMEHFQKDAWWKEVCYMHQWNEVDIPILHVCGWYDDDGISTYKNFPGMRKNAKSDRTKREQELIIGPWPHKLNKSTKCGDMDFGPNALIDLETELFLFFSHHLAGEIHSRKEFSRLPYNHSHDRCRIFIMGENQWHSFSDWPLKEAVTTKYFLHSQGNANSVYGDGVLSTFPPTTPEPADQYDYNPQDPVPYVTDPVRLQLGEACDQQSIERRPDVLVYSTPPLEKDCVVCGRVFLHIVCSSSSPGTDFTAKLVDVYPNGKAIQLCDGIQRAEYRDSLEKPDWLEKNQIIHLTVDLWATGIRFFKGHQIRLEISSSACPKFYPHSNTKENPAEAIHTEIAHQTIYHEPGSESYLLLDILPEKSGETQQ